MESVTSEVLLFMFPLSWGYISFKLTQYSDGCVKGRNKNTGGKWCLGHARIEIQLFQDTAASRVPTSGKRGGRCKDRGSFGLGVLRGGRMLDCLLYPWLPFVFPTEVLCW